MPVYGQNYIAFSILIMLNKTASKGVEINGVLPQEVWKHEQYELMQRNSIRAQIFTMFHGHILALIFGGSFSNSNMSKLSP